MSWECLAEVLKRVNHVYLCGNGGSAANAQHLANDWLGCGIKAHALTADVAVLTMIANDYGYDQIFSYQVARLVQPDDLVIVLSGSGNSPNILAALTTAKSSGAETWAITGGGEAAMLADYVLHTPGTMQEAEEEQLRLGHCIADYIKAGFAIV